MTGKCRIGNTILRGCAALLLLVMLGQAGALAGQPVRPVPGKPGAGQAEEMESIDDLQKYQSFRYIGGGRDPFTFRKAKEVIEEAPGFEGDAGGAGPQPEPQKDLTPEKMRAYLIAFVRQIESLMLIHNYKDALQRAQAHRDTIASKWDLGADAELNRLFRRLSVLQQTAKRLLNQQEIKAEFDKLNLSIGGIRWTPTGSAALINESILEPGAVIRMKGRQPVQIETIEEDGVVFIYKGQRFRKTMNMFNLEPVQP